MRKPLAPWALTLAGLAAPLAGLAQTPAPTAAPPTPAAQTPEPPAQPSLVAAAPAQTRAGVDLLIRQAERWLSQDRADLAASSIERALAADPRNANALAVAARIEAARDNRTAAAAYLTRLRAAGGTEEQRAQVDSAVRGATIDRSALDAARQLARDGKAADAAARYRSLFGREGPPEQFALEYYQTLAGTDAGAREGTTGLQRLAERPNADARARLAYAQTLTYQPQTRAEGIRRLSELAEQPGIGAEARRAWRQALVWGIGDPAASPQVDNYLQRFPEDADLRRRAEASRVPATPPDPGADARREGFARLEGGGLRDANRQFETALTANPNDADALGGLGIVRLREGKTAEARSLLERAIAADPARAAQWQRALDGASYGAELAEGRALLRAGKLDEADAVLRRAVRREAEDKTDAEVALGELALKRNDPASAEQRFRTALTRRPGFAPAQLGLNQALRAQGRVSEIVAVNQPRPVQSPADAQVAQLREEAARSGDPGIAGALLRNAMAIAPSDPWVRLDLARALRRQGRAGEGRALVEELAVRQAGPETLMAAALFADEDGRPADVEALVNRIPPGRRSPDMARLQQRARTQAEVARAAAMLGTGSGLDGRQRLLMLAARPDPSGTTVAAVIRAFADANDRYGAAEAGRIGQTVNRSGGGRAQLAIASALLGAGLEAEAAALADAADQTSLPADQKRDLASLRTGIAIRAADRLNEAGDQAQAFERLRPALAGNPQNPELRLALARLYQGARRPGEALLVAEEVLARDPRDLDARRSAVDAAIGMRDRARAEALVAEGLALAPQDARATVLEARVARAFGQDSRARRALETAAVQRQQELGRPVLAQAGGAAQPVSFPGMENPFARGGMTTPMARGPIVAQPADPVARDIATQLAAIEDQTAPRLQATVGGRSRSGSAGIDRLQEISGAVTASVAPGGIGGRLSATVSPVTIDSGRLGNDASTRQRFGSNLLGGGSANSNSTASGIGLSLGYTASDWLKLDVGTSPLGFHATNVLGGVELAPAVTDNLRLRFTAERRAITDSLLSWAGVKDSRQGRFWGGVTRSGGRGQVEIPVGRGYIYAGGGYARYEGDGVASNSRIEGGAGFGYPILRDGDTELTTGLDLVYFGFDRNLRYFTYGQGGYYSPQTYTAINVPLDYRSRIGDFSYRVGGTIGYVNWREDASNAFPTNAALQAQAEAAARADNTIVARFPGQSRSGLIGGIRADLDYALTPKLSIGGAFRYDKAANFDETRVLLRLNNRF
ncbi:BCSC C-terminal domain-containing protein [Belnapia sp. T6]|uniref:BCSC C-terminal domain-containing protein n=1 Tax=Belnapia mucosa TaxID=2804532 RepID=A0ABS1V435_9PROT|nr:cellulose biosynthesis protein BcsC [Belnapia mucosa]MBL6456440.1 BCSC C-terminal domain-containing protein [Belnapia mucosa]